MKNQGAYSLPFLFHFWLLILTWDSMLFPNWFITYGLKKQRAVVRVCNMRTNRRPPTTKTSSSSSDVYLHLKVPKPSSQREQRCFLTISPLVRLKRPPVKCPSVHSQRSKTNIPALTMCCVSPCGRNTSEGGGGGKKTSSRSSPTMFPDVPRCQGSKIKVPGCGVPQLETGLQCVHSSLEGGDERSARRFFFAPLPASGLILRRWIMTLKLSPLAASTMFTDGAETECQPCWTWRVNKQKGKLLFFGGGGGFWVVAFKLKCSISQAGRRSGSQPLHRPPGRRSLLRRTQECLPEIGLISHTHTHKKKR